METCFDCCNREHGYFSTDEGKYIRKVLKLKEEHPDKVRIIKMPEENDGCLYCELPVEWFCIRVPVKRVLTDEQREVQRVRMMQLHERNRIRVKRTEK